VKQREFKKERSILLKNDVLMDRSSDPSIHPMLTPVPPNARHLTMAWDLGFPLPSPGSWED